MKLCKVISGFPGIGKSYVFKNQDKIGIKCVDSDSSMFSWTTDAENQKIRNPFWPSNYIQHLHGLLNDDSIDYIFVSTHKEVREAMKANNIEYTLIYPMATQRTEYISRYTERKSPPEFIAMMYDKFAGFVQDCTNDMGYTSRIVLDDENETLLDVIIRNMED